MGFATALGVDRDPRSHLHFMGDYTQLRLHSASAAAFLLLTLGIAGCAISLGPEVARPISEHGASVGGELEGLVYFSRGRGIFSRGEGPVVGMRLEQLHRVGAGLGPWQTRGAILAGYSASPLPYRPRVGIEPIIALGYGDYPLRSITAAAVSFGPRLSVPIRLTPSKPAWEVDAVADITPMLVPFLGGSMYYPLGREPESTIRGELSGGLLFRFHLWSPLSP